MAVLGALSMVVVAWFASCLHCQRELNQTGMNRASTVVYCSVNRVLVYSVPTKVAHC